jgi:hypothetical protein
MDAAHEMMAKIEANMKADWEAGKATDLEAAPEEKESELEDWEGPQRRSLSEIWGVTSTTL